MARAAAAAAGPSAEMVAEMRRFLAVEGVDVDRDGGLGVISDCHFRKTGTEYDRKPGIK